MSTGFRGVSWAIILVLLMCRAAFVASAAVAEPATPVPSTSQQAENLDELDEVIVDGRKASNSPVQLRVWIRRLVGQFKYAGYVDLHGKGNHKDQLPVRGQGVCTAFGTGPGVLCNIRVTWPEVNGANGEEIPGGVSTLNPATILYGIQSSEVFRIGVAAPPYYLPAIHYTIVGNDGLAEPALGQLFGDTLISKAPCMNVPGNCQRVTHIHAPPDGKIIEMQIDFERDGRDSRQLPVRVTSRGAGPAMSRIPLITMVLLTSVLMLASGQISGQTRGAPPAKSKPKGKADEATTAAARVRKLAELDTWLRRLPGHFRIDGQVVQTILVPTGGGSNTLGLGGAKVRGTGDCTGIGDGPGVECVIDLSWIPITWAGRFLAQSENFTLSPAALLFGIDSDALMVRYLQVDDAGRAFNATGDLTDDTLLVSECMSIRKKNCVVTYRITAKPDGGVVKIDIHLELGGTDFTFLLHREVPADEKIEGAFRAEIVNFAPRGCSNSAVTSARTP